MIKVIATICFIGSVIAFAIGTLGFYKFPDPYTKIHAVSVGDTIGVALAGAGVFLLSPDWILRIKLTVLLILFWIVNPVMSHMIAKAGVIHGISPARGTKFRDEVNK